MKKKSKSNKKIPRRYFNSDGITYIEMYKTTDDRRWDDNGCAEIWQRWINICKGISSPIDDEENQLHPDEISEFNYLLFRILDEKNRYAEEIIKEEDILT